MVKDRSFSQFRILMTGIIFSSTHENNNCVFIMKIFIINSGKNSNDHHYLACSGFEIYGSLNCTNVAAISVASVPLASSTTGIITFYCEFYYSVE